MQCCRSGRQRARNCGWRQHTANMALQGFQRRGHDGAGKRDIRLEVLKDDAARLTPGASADPSTLGVTADVYQGGNDKPQTKSL